MYEMIKLDDMDLSPYLEKDTINTHLKIYQDNLKKLNSLLKSAFYDYSYSMRDLVDHIDIFPLEIRGEILYYLSSILNHSLYFSHLSNKNHIEPVGIIKRDIDKYFGSYEKFKQDFIKKALELKGSGYTFLVRDDRGILKIINTSNEDSPYYYGMEPIISLDLWEHAYFLQYRNHRDIYIANFFKIIDFEKINYDYEELLKRCIQ